MSAVLAIRRPTRDARFANDEMYEKYAVTIAFRDRVCGGTPKSDDLIASWIKAKTGHDDALTEEQFAEALATSPQAADYAVAKETEKGWTGFPQDPDGLFLWSRQIKAMFRESATMLRVTTTKIGSKQIFQHGFEVKGRIAEDRVHFLTVGGNTVKKPDGFMEGPIHVQTPQGPRSALKRVDYLHKPGIMFDVWVLKTAAAEKRHVGEDDLIRMLTFAQENGLGSSRSQGYGKCDVIGFERTR